MKIFHDPGNFPKLLPTAITTGSFDGVHIGHKAILHRLTRLAREIHGESLLITFHPHPRKVLYPETAGKNLLLINSQEEKIRLLQQTGLDNLLIINFTLEFSRLSSLDFIRKILVAQLNARKVIVGFNHHFGYQQEGGYDELYSLGQYHNFEVEEIPEQDIENETVSSTRIRKALLEGKIQRANAYLDHFYMIIGKFQPIPEQAGWYTIRIEEDCKLIPPEGSYAVSIENQGDTKKALVLVEHSPDPEYRPNLGRTVRILPLETFHYQAGVPVTVFFHKLLREQHHLSADELKTDCQQISDLLY